MKRITACIALCHGLCAVAIAQNVPTPAATNAIQGPLIQKRAPDFASWTVVTTLGRQTNATTAGAVDASGASAAQPPPPLSSRVVTKTGKIYHVTIADSTTQLHEVWTDGLTVAMEPTGNIPALFVAIPPPGGKNPLYVSFAQGDFEGFGWLSTNNFKGMAKDKKSNRDVMDFDTGEGSSPRQIARVDAQTRLPLFLEEDGVVTTYTFSPTPPTSMQAFPRSIADLVRSQKDMNESFARKPGKPF